LASILYDESTNKIKYLCAVRKAIARAMILAEK
jgi:hypothetical protein